MNVKLESAFNEKFKLKVETQLRSFFFFLSDFPVQAVLGLSSDKNHIEPFSETCISILILN